MKEFIKRINKTLIVSVQGVDSEPTNDPNFLAVSARAVVEAGAKVLRCSQIEHIKAIKEEVGPSIGIIGLIKRKCDDSPVFITPGYLDIDELVSAGVDAIALDATNRIRPNSVSVEELVNYTRKKYPNIILMADCATIEEVKEADRIGFDIVSSTLRGYTDETKGLSNIQNDFEFLRKAMSLKLNALFIAEGGIWTPNDAKKALMIADAIVVGSAITRPHLIAAKYFEEIK